MSSTTQETQEKQATQSELTSLTFSDIVSNDENEAAKLEHAGSTLRVERCDAGCVNMERKDVVIVCHFLIVLTCVAAYFGQELSQYLDDDTNRKEYTLDSLVDTMPLPFVYVDHFANISYSSDGNSSYSDGYDIIDGSSNVSCMLDASYYVQDGDNLTWFYMDSYSNGTFLHGSTTIDEILTHRTSTAWLLAQRYFLGYSQFLLVPPSNLQVTVDSKSKLTVGLYCPDGVALKSDYIWYVMDHRQQLYNFDTFGQAMDNFVWTSDYVYSGYELLYSYEWFTHENKIDKEVEYDYYVTTVESTFAITDPKYKLEFQISPNAAGKKTTFVTDRALDFLEIFSLTGGMFTTVNSIVAIIAVYLIWGFDFKIIKFDGIARNADPSYIEQRKFDAYMKRYTQKYVKTQLESPLKDIKELKALIAKMEANTVSRNDSN